MSLPQRRHHETQENRKQHEFIQVMIAALTLLCCFPASAYLDLAAARLQRLDNGLTLIVLEDHTLPVVSVQMLYRVGARNEVTGATGLAHFLEHMAFRSTKNFPGTQVVSSIYAVGGEWHAYTWLDQTTYFETAPRQNLDLLLRIESDRMARLDLPAGDVPAERGAVLAEMHGYENDPMSVLQDNVLYLVFLAHPYRNNTIGWESDVTHIGHADLMNFYRQHYQPGNAVLAVVGDVQAEQVRQSVQEVFGGIPGKPATPPPHTIEPEQRGVRRIYLRGDVEQKYFKIAYRAPAASDPGYAAFLLLQELLAGGSGVNFLQNDWGTPVRADSQLAGIGQDLTTWFPPSAQDYVFIISGSVPAGAGERATERAIESGILALRKQLKADDEAMAAALEQAKQAALRALVFDVETTEDAAHQLAFFTGLGSMDVLTGLPQAINQASAEDIVRVLDRFLQSNARTIGWYTPKEVTSGQAVEPIPAGTAGSPAEHEAGASAAVLEDRRQTAAPKNLHVATQESMAPAIVTHLGNGTPVILQRSPLSATVSLKVLTPAAAFPAGTAVSPNQPVWGVSSLDFALQPDELGAAISQARAALQSAAPLPPAGEPPANDPAALLERYFGDMLGLKAVQHGRPGTPVLLVVSGDIQPGDIVPLLERGFGDLSPALPSIPAPIASPQKMDIEATLEQPVAQGQLGYLVRAPAPGDADASAWQMALYILSHGYEGRLGKEAISRQGLIYYIDSAYHSDGGNGWITLTMGVDPDKLPAMKELLRKELLRLLQEPPSRQEVAAAKQYLLGRQISAAQSNPELADRLARQFLWYGHMMSYGELEKHLKTIQRKDIIELLPAFVAGCSVAIRNPRQGPAPGENAER